MITFFKDLWWSFRFPWSRAAVKKIRPYTISICPEHRLAECERLYEQNIPHGLPSDHLEEYTIALRRGDTLTLLVESGGKLVGTFGLNYGPGRKALWLCYVLVDPEFHRGGIGTTMFFSSMALLPDLHPFIPLAITALENAFPFYQRLGFKCVAKTKHTDGQVLLVGAVSLSPGLSRHCRKWLTDAGVRLPQVDEIPTSITPPEPSAEIEPGGATPPPAPSAERPTRPPSLQ